MTTLAQPRSFTRFRVAPLTPIIGAEIHDIDLGVPLPDETIADIRSALLTYKVIFFRDQEISEEQHIAFARRFGDLEVHPMTPKDQPHQETFHLRTNEVTRPGSKVGADLWHSDVTWRAEPSLGSILRCRIMPEVGGDTMFADMVAAYEGLSPALKEWLCSLTAVHDGSIFATLQGKPKESFWEQFPPQRHPVVRTHPETGERALYVNCFHHPYRGAERQGKRLVARSPLRPGLAARIPVPLPLEAQFDRLLGQPRLPALCRGRLLSGDARDGAGDRGRRQAVLRSGAVTRTLENSSC